MSIQAAAERLAKAVERLRTGDEIYHQTFQAEADEGTVAREYLRLTDPAPADPDRLGFQEVSDGHALYDEYGDEVIAVRGGSLWLYGTEVPSNDPPTMGQLRCLCLGLKISLTEQPNG
jgi:hypothetical protein